MSRAELGRRMRDMQEQLVGCCDFCGVRGQDDALADAERAASRLIAARVLGRPVADRERELHAAAERVYRLLEESTATMAERLVWTPPVPRKPRSATISRPRSSPGSFSSTFGPLRAPNMLASPARSRDRRRTAPTRCQRPSCGARVAGSRSRRATSARRARCACPAAPAGNGTSQPSATTEPG